jgi:hypothetical protein
MGTGAPRTRRDTARSPDRNATTTPTNHHDQLAPPTPEVADKAKVGCRGTDRRRRRERLAGSVPAAAGKSVRMTAQDIVATRAANALIPDATTPIETLMGPVGRGIGRYRRKHDGLWVGGHIVLTPAELRFAPNAVNRALHNGDPSMTIPLRTVRQVGVEPGFFTKIVAVTWTGGVARFRCFRAARLADQIRLAAA